MSVKMPVFRNLFMQDVPVATIQTLRLLRSVDARVWRLGEELFEEHI